MHVLKHLDLKTRAMVRVPFEAANLDHTQPFHQGAGRLTSGDIPFLTSSLAVLACQDLLLHASYQHVVVTFHDVHNSFSFMVWFGRHRFELWPSRTLGLEP